VKKLFWIMIVLTLFAMLLSACGSGKKEDAGKKNASTVLTEAASTAEALMRTMAAISPTPRPVTPTPVTPTATITPIPSPTLEPGQPSPTFSGDMAGFGSDLTIPDGTVFAPNATFVKMWRLNNTGTTTWTPAYTVVYASGDQMGAPASIALPVAVPPGGSVDISVPMTAPVKEGSYTANFLLANQNGQRFGLNGSITQPFYVVIVVSKTEGTPAASPTAVTPTAGGSVTPGTGGNIVDWVFLSVDNANANACPHTFNFVGQIVLKNPTTLTYRLEVLSNDASKPAPVLDPVTVNAAAGTQIVNFQLNFGIDFNGVARLHVTAPENIYSNPVNLVLTCPAPYPTP
jgi:hypothetical protein